MQSQFGRLAQLVQSIPILSEEFGTRRLKKYWGGLAKSILVGAVSGAASAGIGQIAQSVTTTIFHTTKGFLNFALLAVTKGVMHGAAQGIIQGVSGGNPGQSFLTALATSIVGDIFGADLNGSASEGLGWAGSVRGSVIGHSLFGSLTGGVVSNMQGGNFWEGAAIGLTIGLLNHAGKKLYPAIDRWLNPPKSPCEAFKQAIDAFGLSLATKELLFSMIENPTDLTDFTKNYTKLVAGLGKVAGGVSVYTAIKDYIANPTTAGLIKVVVNTSLSIGTAVASGGTLSGAVGWGMSFADSSGLADKFYNFLGNGLNNLTNTDVGLNFFHDARSTILLIQYKFSQ